MSRPWTTAQRCAINSRNGSVLVSAAAGSGKTAVLVERVIQRIIDKEKPTNVENILVVTFTKAAAGEMLERISNSLSDLIKKNPGDSFLKRQKMFLPSASICTIDSFCNQFVKENCQLLEIAPDFTMLDENELKLLQNEVIAQVLEKVYTDNTPESNALLELFSDGRNDVNLINSILSIYNFSISSANPKKWIDDHFEYYFENVPVEKTIWGEYCLDRVKSILEHLIVKCDKILIDGGDDNKPGITARESIMGAVTSMKYALELIENDGEWDRIRDLVNGLSTNGFGRFSTAEKDDHYYEIQGRVSALKKDFDSISKIMTCYSEDFKNDIDYLRPVMSAFKNCVLRFMEAFNNAKTEKNAYDYADILHMSLKLLVKENPDGTYEKTPLAVELSEKYNEILIDEFQDTNEAQDTLFNAISKDGNNLFMVGDVKQSIYRFRQAMPEIFLSYKDKYDAYIEEDDNYPSKIVLDKNFRSRKGIVDGVNFFFDYLMTRKMGEIDYKLGDGLTSGAEYCETDNLDVHFHIVDGSKSRGSNFDEEILYVGKTIKELVESGMTVGNKDKERPIKYSDICILSRKLSDKAEVIARGLNEMGVPAHYEKKRGFFENAEVVTMLSFLNIIDNPVQDVPLLSVMLSPMFPFTEDDITKMRCKNRSGSIYELLKENYNCDIKVKAFLDTVYQLRMLSVTLGVGELIRRIFELTAYDSVVGAMENGEKHILNLQLLIDYAESYEQNGGHGLPGFIRYIEKLRKNKFDLNESALVSGNDNAVEITTIHGSKGLEYPVVFVMNCGDSFGGRGGDKTVVDRTMGIGTICYDKKRNIEFKTQPYTTVQIKNSLDELNEEMRIYYVAMTRAREKLYIVGNMYKPESKIKEIYDRFYTGDEDNSVALSLANSFLQWAVLAMLRHPSMYELRKNVGIMNCQSVATDCKIDFQIVQPPIPSEAIEAPAVEKAPINTELLNKIEAKTLYKYPYAEYAGMPVKYSASQIDKDSQTQYIASENPAFMGKDKLTPSQRGTLMHKFMEKCDFALAGESVEKEVARLKELGVFNENEAEAINIPALKAFFDSPLYARIKTAQFFEKEKSFRMSVPISFINKNIPDELSCEKIMIQGVMDGLIINNGISEIVDYKTDRVTNEQELIDRYSEQMRAYKTAAQECFGCKRVSVTLYSFSLSKEISLKL